MPVTPLDRASAARVAALPSQAVSSQPFAELLHSKQTRIGLNPASVLDALSPAARRAFLQIRAARIRERHHADH